MKEGDVIVAVNGKKVESESLGGAVSAHVPGSKITLDYLRGGEKGKAEVALIDREAFFAARSSKDPEKKEPGHIVLGVTVEEDSDGVFAFKVENGCTGKAAGRQKGDRIPNVNGKAVKSLDELEVLLKKVKSGAEVSMRLVRGDETIDVVVIGSSDKGGAKLVSTKSTKAEKKETTPAKPPAEKKPDPPAEKKQEEAGVLGVGVGPVEGGLEVEIVVPDSAAAAYGIKVGDVIRQVNGKNTTSIDELKAALGGAPAGGKAKVLLRRKGADVTLNLVLGARGAKVEPPKSKPAAAAPKPKEKPPEKPKKKTEVRGTLGIHARQTGEGQVVITRVLPGAAAEKAGVTIAIENHGSNLVNTPDSLKWLVELVPSRHLGIALAPYHLEGGGLDSSGLAALIEALGNRIAMFYAWQHGMGCMKKLPKEQELLQMPGRGKLDFAPVVKALKKVEYRGLTSIFMHPVPRGVPILADAASCTAEINRARRYLAGCI